MARTRTRVLYAVLCGLLTAVGLQVAVAAPASAIPGLANVTVAGPVTSDTFQQVVANCPAGLRVIGGGVRLNGPNAEVSITYMAPTTTATAYEGRAYEDQDGFAGNWQLIVTAICAITPPGYEIQTAMSPMASPASASVAASCTAGRQVLGTGGAVHPGRGVVVLTGIVPAPLVGPTTVTTIGAEVQGGFAGTWNVQSWAICAFPVAGHAVVLTTSVIDSSPTKAQTSTCPAGRVLHGVGFQIGGGPGEVFLNMAIPNPPGPVSTAAPAFASEDQTGFAGNWGLRSYAVCAP